MSTVNSTDANGATPATAPLVINMELADWVYHRADNDQGMSIGEIEANATVFMTSTLRSTLVNTGFTVAPPPDNFIYDANTGFACAIVQNSATSYTIAIRGTDVGNGSFADIVSAAAQTYNVGNPNLDANDIEQDVALAQGTLNPQNQVQDALNVISLLQAQVPGAAINLVGQSLGGGVAGVAAAITGLPATIIDPAPFAKQLSVQAMIAAATYVGVANAANTFYQLGLSPFSTTDADGNSNTTVDAYILANYGQNIYSQYENQYNALMKQYNGRTNIVNETVSGEILSFYSSLLGAVGATPLPFSDPNPILLYSSNNAPAGYTLSGIYEALALHSPTLAALSVATQNMPLSFAALIENDVVLQNAFFGQSMGNAGAISNPRSDQVNVTSKVNGNAPDPGILERALLKTVGATTGFYAYFSQLFGKSFTSGALAAPANPVAGTPSLHSAFEELTLDVFRDKVAGTSTVNNIYAVGTTGVSILSAVGGSGGAPLGDGVIIHESDITATASTQLAPDGLQFGQGDLNLIIWNDVEQAAGSDFLTGEFLGLSKDYVFGTPAAYDPLTGLAIESATPAGGIPWDVAVAQGNSASGSGAFSFDPNDPSTGARSGDASQNLAVFGGAGTNTIKDGSGDNFIDTGDGNSTVTLSSGQDIVVCGAGTDTINAGGNSEIILGGTGNDTLNAITNIGGVVSPDEREFFAGGSGSSTINVDYSNTTIPYYLDIEGGSGANTINLDNINKYITPAPAGYDTLVPPLTVIWGGAGNTTFNITNTLANYNDPIPDYDIYVLSVTGLTSQTFANLDNNALADYVVNYTQQHGDYSEEGQTANPIGIIILDSASIPYDGGYVQLEYNHVFGSYTYNQLDGPVRLLTTGTVLDISQFQSLPSGVYSDASGSGDSDGPALDPTITGTVKSQTSTSQSSVQPFSGVTIGDSNKGSTETLTITIGGAGGVLTDGTGFSGLETGGTPGVYTLAGTAGAVMSELDSLRFTPGAGTPNSTSTSTFTLTDTTSAKTSITDATTSVIDSDPAVAPTISGTVSNQATTSEVSLKPFSGVTIGDANANSTETVYIVVNGTGTLVDGAGYSGLAATGNPGQFMISGTAAAVTQELRAMVFTPAKGSPNTSSTTSFTLGDVTSPGTSALDYATSVINSDPATAAAPTITGAVANQATTSEASVKPFSGATVADANAGSTETLTITVGGAGGVLSDGTGFSGLKAAGTPGVYTLAGTAAGVTSELDALVFKSAAGTPNAASTSTLKLTDATSAGSSVTNSTTTVIDTDPAVAPTITGTVANQATTSEAPVKPFSGVTIGDSNASSTETLYIVVSGSGTLADGAGYSGLTATGNPGQFMISGTAAAVTQELRAAIFTPVKGSPNTSSTTSFTLGDITTPGSYVLNYTTSVIDTDSVSAVVPVITGTVAGQTTTSEASVKPFSGVTIGDANAGSTDTLTITGSGLGGALVDGAGYNGLVTTSTPGVYRLSGTASAVTSELDALVFTSTAGYPNASLATAFTLTDVTSAGTSASDTKTTIIDTDPAVAPTITGTVANQATTSETPVKPFSGVTIGDANVSSTETLYIVVNGTGTLADGAGYSSLTATGSPGQFVIAGTAAAVTQELRAAVFTSAKGSPNTSSTTSFTLGDIATPGPYVLNYTTSVIDTDSVSAAAPVITGTVAGQATTSEASVRPFSGVTVADANAGSTETLTISGSGLGGALVDGAGYNGLVTTSTPGVYKLSGTAAVVTSELDALVFTSTAGYPNASLATAFTLTDVTSAGTSASDTKTTIIDTDPAVAPKITGTVANQVTTSGTPVAVFSGVTIADANAGPAETLTITVGGAGGTLADGTGFSGLKTTGTAGVYTLSGTAAAVSAELDALLFQSANIAQGAEETSTFTLIDKTSGGTSATDNTATLTFENPGPEGQSYFGGGNTISFTAASNSVFTLVNTGTSQDTLNGAAGSIYLDSAQASFNGSSNYVYFNTGSGNVASLSGTNGNWDELSGPGGTVNFNGAQAGIAGGGYNINIVSGSGNAMLLSNTANASDAVIGSAGSIYLESAQASFNGSSNYIYFYAGSGNAASLTGTNGNWDELSGPGGTVDFNGAQAGITGGGYDINIVSGTGNTMTLSNTANTADAVIGSAGSIYLDSAQASFNGSSNYVYFNSGSGNVASLSGTNGNWDEIYGSAGQVNLSGAQAGVTGTGNTINYTSGSSNNNTEVIGQNNTINANGSNSQINLEGTTSVSIFDLGNALRINIGSATQTDTISGFATSDATAVADLQNGVGGYASVSAVLSALHSDGNGGTALSLGSSGSIDFVNTAPNQLHASNFAIG